MAKYLTRSQKTNRAYTLAVAGTGSGVLAVVLLFVSGVGLFLLFAVIAVLCFLGFRRTVS
jgi:predicted RND superfamily exporter protein